MFYNKTKKITAFLIAALVLICSSPASSQDTVLQKITKALPNKAPAKPKKARKLLIFTRTAGFRHGSIPVGTRAVTLMGDKTGAYTALHTEDPSFFEPAKLKAFDAVLMLNTTGDCLRSKGKEGKQREEKLKKSLVDFVTNGGGLVGFHSATDTYRGWKAYNKMMGGAFDGHPWHKDVPIKNLDPKHPINAAFGGKGFQVKDEIYQFRADTALPSDRRFLLSLDTAKMDVSRGKRKDGLYPISWVSTFGKGRTFYCSLGHRNEIYWNPMLLQHYLAGIQYAFGDLPAIATPSAKGTGDAK